MEKVFKTQLPFLERARQPGVVRWIVWTVLALGSLCFFWIYGNSAQDDAYITFRYARNLLLGRGFVYNPGEHVLGTSTPLYTLLLALHAWLSGLDVVRCAWLLGMLSLWIGAGLLYEIGEGSSRPTAIAASLIYLSLPFLRLMVGMESFFLLALTIAPVWSFQRGREGAAAVLCGLLVLVRIEMVFLAFLLATYALITRRRFPTWIWPAAAIPAIWFAWAVYYFGSPLPNSAFAKLLAARHSFIVGLIFHWIDMGL